MPLTLTADQHKVLGHALALAHALHSEMAGNGLGLENDACAWPMAGLSKKRQSGGNNTRFHW